MRRISTGAAAVGLGAWLATVPVLHAVLADADRGLDAMDESHYLMAAQPWASDKAFNGVFGWYSGPLLRLVGGDLGRFRVLAALLLIGAAAVLAAAVRRASERVGGLAWPSWLRALWPPAAVSAALCYYTVFVRTPSYNWFAAAGLMLLASGLLGALVLDRAGAAAVVAGVLVSLGAFVTAIGKATTALAAAGVLLLAVLLHVVGLRRDAVRWRALPPAVGAAAVTAVGLLAVHAFAVHSPAFTVATYRRVGAMLSRVDPGHYAPGAVLPTARAGLRNVLLDRPHGFLPLLLLVPVAAVVTFAVRRPRPAGTGAVPRAGSGLPFALAHAALWWLTLVAVLAAYPGGVAGLGMSSPPLVVAAEGAVLVALFVWVLDPAGPRRPAGDGLVVEGDPGRGGRRPGTALLAAVALLAMGAAYPVGTNVEYATQLHGGFPVLLAAAVMGVSAIGRGAVRLAVASLAAGTVLLAGVLVPTTRAVAPYRIAPLDRQTEPRQIVPGAPEVFVDASTAAWVDDLRSLARSGGFVQGSPVLDLTWHPASVLVLGGRAPSVLLPAFPGWPHPDVSAAYALSREDASVWRAAWLLVPSGQDDALTDAATEVVGRAFPSDYELLGTVTAPYDGQVQGLWRPRPAASTTLVR